MGTITRNFANNIVTGGKVDGTDGLTGTIPASNVSNDTLGNLTAFPATVGDFVETRASDVTASPSTEGQLFYNTTSGTLKGISFVDGAWASGGNASTAAASRYGGGTQNDAFMAGGSATPGNVANVEEYNGTSWSSATNLPSGRQDGGEGGTVPAGIIWVGEGPTNSTLEYNGSSWTSGGNYPASYRSVYGLGTQTAALGAGGWAPGGPNANDTVAEYNGSTWTAGTALPSARKDSNGSGTQTAGMIIGGTTNNNPDVISNAEEYNGTTWTAASSYPAARRQIAVFGENSDNIVGAGGLGATPFSQAVSETNVYNGTSWTTQGALAAGETHMGDTGTVSAGLVQGGVANYPTYTSSSQEWTGAQYAAKTLTTS